MGNKFSSKQSKSALSFLLTIARYVNVFVDQYSYFERIDHLFSNDHTTFGNEFLILQLPDYNQVGALR